jgi:hypothetical protein
MASLSVDAASRDAVLPEEIEELAAAAADVEHVRCRAKRGR